MINRNLKNCACGSRATTQSVIDKEHRRPTAHMICCRVALCDKSSMVSGYNSIEVLAKWQETAHKTPPEQENDK